MDKARSCPSQAVDRLQVTLISGQSKGLSIHRLVKGTKHGVNGLSPYNVDLKIVIY